MENAPRLRQGPSGGAPGAVICDDVALSPAELLAKALAEGGFWSALNAACRRSKCKTHELRIVIKPDLEGFEVRSPSATDPALVEALVDLLHDEGFSQVDVCATADSSYFWAENRDVASLATLLGYSYSTPKGRAYDVRDLAEDLTEGGFGEHGVLAGTQIGSAWRDAHFRICFARNKTDEREGYALCLSGLLGVLPLADKEYYYRQRLKAGDVVCEVLRAMPVDFSIVDATVSAHGSGGARAPVRTETGCVIAGAGCVLVDFVGAMKMAVDPYVSPLASTVYRTVGLPERYTISGNLAVHRNWRNVHPVLMESRRRRDALHEGDRLLVPLLQNLDPELFPLKHVANAKLNPKLSGFFANVDDDPAALWTLALVNYAIGAIGDWREAYRVLSDKDSIRRIAVPLGFDPTGYRDEDFERLRAELSQAAALLEGVESSAEGLRWREVDGATLFEFERRLPIPFDTFVERVDVARTIQYMNDYVGGTLAPLARDSEGRVVRQAERNLYLPQPNYLVLYGGKHIDVSKIEIMDYAVDSHRMYWKTVKSENQSATYDDGVVSFTRDGAGTCVRIVGRQQFTLPPFWQAVDLNRLPKLKEQLVTHAYKTFFDRTCANFEALVENRDVLLGRPWHAARDPLDSEPLPIERLEQLAMRLVERVQPLFAAEPSERAAERPAMAPAGVQPDADGFFHFDGVAAQAAPRTGGHWTRVSAAAASALTEFLSGLGTAMCNDAAFAARPLGTRGG